MSKKDYIEKIVRLLNHINDIDKLASIYEFVKHIFSR